MDTVEFTTKQEKCRYGFGVPDMINGELTAVYYCRHKDNQKVSCEECDNCTQYKSRYIEYPILVNEIKTEDFTEDVCLYNSYIGKLVAIRPCAKECSGKTYIGLFLGELAHCPRVTYDEKSQVLNVKGMYNPAMFVPDLNKIVFGYESWWKVIENEKELKDITDDDISNVWYVRLAKTMFGNA